MIEESRSSEIEKVIYMSAKNLRVFCRLFVVICAMCSMTSCHKSNKTDDSDYTKFNNFMDSTRALAVVDPEGALNYIDKAEVLGVIGMDSIHWARTYVYSQTFEMDKMSVELHAIIDSAGIDRKSSLYLSALSRLAEVYVFQNQAQEAIRCNMIGDSLARLAGNKRMSAEFHYNMGVCLVERDNEAGVRYLKESIDMFKQISDDNSVWNELMHVNSYLCNVYVMQQQFSDAIRVGEELQKSIDSISATTDMNKYDNGGTIRSNLCGLLCVAYAGEGRMMEAGMEYAKCQQYNSSSPTIPILMANCLVSMRRIDEAVEKLEELHHSYREKGDTVCYEYAGILSSLKDCYGDKNMYEKALACANEEIDVRNAIYSDELEDRVSEWEIRYKSRVNESALHDANLEKRITRLVILLLSGVLIVAIVFIVMMIRHSRGMNAKNKALAVQMNRDMKEKSKEVDADGQNAIKEDAVEAVPEEAIEQINTFVGALLSKKLFCDGSFQRDDLITELGLSRRLVTRYFEPVMGKSFSKFLAVTRVEYAADQIRLYPNYTIEAIAADSGISSRATFYRLFTDYFGISPTEYRRQCLSLAKEK